MSPAATAANLAWLAASAPAAGRFHRALNRPAETQDRLLRDLLARDARCAYGRAHDFASIRTYEEFTRRVPVAGYDELEPWIARIRRGEPAILSDDPVTHFVPTSGSTGACKLIPFTAGLQRAFNAALGPWMVDLFRRHPAAILGPAYWSISPAAREKERELSAVSIGFEDDSRYLGGARARLVESLLAAPAALRHAVDMEQFRYLTLLCLLRSTDLRLISVWHPSFLTLLLDAIPENWDALLSDLGSGHSCFAESLPAQVRSALRLRPQPHTVARLRRADPSRPETIWPALRVVSCWADGHAAGAATELQRRLPGVFIQPKGLLATEAFVTLPFTQAQPVAVCSHFFEFVDEHGAIHPVHDLHRGRSYEVLVTTGGGLWRYRLGDRVEVTAFVGQTPSLRFLGRVGNVSDRFGEKLSEVFVAQSIREACTPLAQPPAFAMLAPEESPDGWHYTLYLAAPETPGLAARLDTALRANPHYALCRDLRQLAAARVFSIARNAYETFASAEVARGARLGDLKPAALSPRTDWSRHFAR